MHRRFFSLLSLTAAAAVVFACSSSGSTDLLRGSPPVEERPGAADPNEPAPPATASPQRPPCERDAKLCGGRCVAIDDPLFGCDPTSCSPCSLPEAKAACQDGRCVVGECRLGAGDCDGRSDNGCETPTRFQPDSCGACGNRCRTNEVCAGGRCWVSCPHGMTTCGRLCIDTSRDPLHCSGCDEACPSPPNADPRCDDGRCSYRCRPGFERCGVGCCARDEEDGGVGEDASVGDAARDSGRRDARRD